MSRPEIKSMQFFFKNCDNLDISSLFLEKTMLLPHLFVDFLFQNRSIVAVFLLLVCSQAFLLYALFKLTHQLNACRKALQKNQSSLQKSSTTSEFTRHFAYADACRHIAHEIKNPIAALQIVSEFMLTEHCSKEKLSHYTNQVFRQVSRLSSLITHMLSYEGPQQKLDSLPLKALLKESTDLIKEKCLSHAIEWVELYANDIDYSMSVSAFWRDPLLHGLLEAMKHISYAGKIALEINRIDSCDKQKKTLNITIKCISSQAISKNKKHGWTVLFTILLPLP